MNSAEIKFRHVADHSNDLIFSINDQAVITSMNAASKSTLGFRPQEMIGQSLYDLTADSTELYPDAHRTTTREHLEKAKTSEKPVSFRTALRMKQVMPGLDIELCLQKIVNEDRIEFQVKSTTVFPEASELYLTREHGSYIISSHIAEGELVTRGILARLKKYFAQTELRKIQVGLSEIILNAIEHGNLGISFEDKTREIENGDYLTFLLKRQKHEKYAGKTVRIDFAFDVKAIRIRIRDQGAGFDHAAYLQKTANDDSMLELEHGRGILISKNIFDQVEYNAKGNQILLVKKRL